MILFTKTLVFGIGNLLRSDDGVGLHIIEHLRKENIGDAADLMEGSTGLDILDAMKGYDRIIFVDAIKSSGEPGSIYKFSVEDFQQIGTLHSFSTHLNMDFFAMIELGETLFPGQMPNDITIVAIEADETTTISDKCTPRVEGAIPEAVALIKGLLS
jgi:hydrogenase maturation protease